MSLPSRERGLKLQGCDERIMGYGVAPLAGAWIEMFPDACYFCTLFVAPLAGAWIEIIAHRICTYAEVSRSPRGSVD